MTRTRGGEIARISRLSPHQKPLFITLQNQKKCPTLLDASKKLTGSGIDVISSMPLLRLGLLACVLHASTGFSVVAPPSAGVLTPRASAASRTPVALAKAAATKSADDVTVIGGRENVAEIPVTMLCGFLGAGKTTILRHLLHNKEGKRIGVIVNDVAAVNVDAKLVQKGSDDEDADPWADDMVELSNGCACCSAGDDFIDAFARLVALSFSKGATYDHIVFEVNI